jgi:hypothetical protein
MTPASLDFLWQLPVSHKRYNATSLVGKNEIESTITFSTNQLGHLVVLSISFFSTNEIAVYSLCDNGSCHQTSTKTKIFYVTLGIMQFQVNIALGHFHFRLRAARRD